MNFNYLRVWLLAREYLLSLSLSLSSVRLTPFFFGEQKSQRNILESCSLREITPMRKEKKFLRMDIRFRASTCVPEVARYSGGIIQSRLTSKIKIFTYLSICMLMYASYFFIHVHIDIFFFFFDRTCPPSRIFIFKWFIITMMPPESPGFGGAIPIEPDETIYTRCFLKGVLERFNLSLLFFFPCAPFFKYYFFFGETKCIIVRIIYFFYRYIFYSSKKKSVNLKILRVKKRSALFLKMEI